MSPNQYSARLIQRIKRTDTVESFRFFSENKVVFKPGQFLQLIFDKDNLRNSELNKYLSFSASPNRDYVEVTKRLSRSKFSSKLKSLKINDQVLIKAPLGNCIFRKEYTKIGFLVGGIGITPVISMIEYIVNNKLSVNIILFYSSKANKDIAFRKEVDSWQKTNSNIKVLYIISDCKTKDKNYISGNITKELIVDNIKDLQERVFFSFGPPRMVELIKGLCAEAGCDNEKVKTEAFIGY